MYAMLEFKDVTYSQRTQYSKIKCNNNEIPSKIEYFFTGSFITSHFLKEHKLLNVIIPENINEIPPFAFKECIHLKNIIIPNNIKYIRELSFAFCESITDIKIPEGVTHIEKGAFFWCKSLKKVSLPGSIIHIDYEAFQNCYSLQEIKYKGVTYTDKNIFNALLINKGITTKKLWI